MTTPKMNTSTTWQYGEQFEVGKYPLRNVRSIASRGQLIAHVNCNFGDGEAIAKLIAAAPDMANVLQFILAAEGLPDPAGVAELKFQARVALAKAGLANA